MGLVDSTSSSREFTTVEALVYISGRQIAFWSDRDDFGLFVMPAMGGVPRKITSPSPENSYDSAACWSSDATELAFAVRDMDGSVPEIVSLETFASRKLGLPGRAGTMGLDLSWSRDGRYFAYVDAAARHEEVTRTWVLRIADGEAFPITDGLTNDWSPTWSPDGRALYFVSNRGGSMDLWQEPIGEDGKPAGTPQRVTVGIGMWRAVFSLDCKKLIYSRGGRHTNIWRVPILSERPATWADESVPVLVESGWRFPVNTRSFVRHFFIANHFFPSIMKARRGFQLKTGSLQGETRPRG